MISRTVLKIFNLLANNLSSKRLLFLFTSLNYIDWKYHFPSLGFDYVRYATLELLSYEINEKKIEGNLAELGVYKGEFAKHMSECFPEKKIYLFDTFEGFDDRDIKKEEKNSLSNARVHNEFSNTSMEEVLAKMPYREKVVMKRGSFLKQPSD